MMSVLEIFTLLFTSAVARRLSLGFPAEYRQKAQSFFQGSKDPRRSMKEALMLEL